jgi:hypothetical protein
LSEREKLADEIRRKTATLRKLTDPNEILQAEAEIEQLLSALEAIPPEASPFLP